MAVMGLLAPLAGLIKVRYGEKADIDSPFFKVCKQILFVSEKLIDNYLAISYTKYFFLADALQNNHNCALSLVYPRNSQ